VGYIAGVALALLLLVGIPAWGLVTAGALAAKPPGARAAASGYAFLAATVALQVVRRAVIWPETFTDPLFLALIVALLAGATAGALLIRVRRRRGAGGSTGIIVAFVVVAASYVLLAAGGSGA
jgi:hypothetical protein